MKRVFSAIMVCLLCLSMFTIFAPKASASDSLVGYWKFDEGSGNIAYDSSGNGNDGTIYTATWVDGKVGKALGFNGIDSYVSIPDSSSLDISGNQMSVEFWVKFDSLIDGSSPYMKFYDKGNAYNSAMLETGNIRFTFWVAGDSSANLDSSRTSWLAGTWYHIAEVYDGNVMSIYVNGALDNSMPMTGNIASTTYPIALGAYTLGGQYFLHGAMDEFKIYDYGRTSQDILDDYNSVSQGPVGYWKFDEGSGNIAYDSAGTNDGIIRGVPSWTTGIVGGALRFDGAQNDYVAMSSQLGVTDAMTVEAWVYPEFDPTNPAEYPQPFGDAGRTIIRKSSCGDDTFELGFYSGFYFDHTNPVPYISGGFIYQGGGAVSLEPVWIPGLISEGHWYHIVITFNRNDYARLYVDGVEKMAVPTEDRPLSTSSRHLTIGQEADTVGGDPLDTPDNPQTWIGKIDEAKIYNYARSADDINQDYQSISCPVGYWKFDEGSGNVAHDFSGNGNDGAIYAGSFVEGKIGYAMNFDGSSQYVCVANSASLTMTRQITVSAWVKSAGIVKTDTIVRKGNGYSLYLEGGHGNVPEVAIFQGGVGKFVSGTTIMTPGLWHHVAGTFDGTNLKIYVNGILEGSLTTPGGIDNQPTLEGNLNLIIAANSGLGDFFNGIIDEVKIYNYARTAQDILNDYNSAFVSLPWKDDFNYNTRNEMKAAGWRIDETSPGWMTLGSSVARFDNDGSSGSSAYFLDHFPVGINDFSVEAKSRWVGRSVGDNGNVYVITERHSYAWAGDGYYPDYMFVRDGVVVMRFAGYTPTLNQWTIFRLEKIGNTIYLYQDNQLEKTYIETDAAPDEITGVGIGAGWASTMEYDYIFVAHRTRFSPTSDGYQFDNSALSKVTVSFQSAYAAIKSAQWVPPTTDELTLSLLAWLSLIVQNQISFGNCFGMSYTAKYYYENPSALSAKYPGYQNLHALSMVTASPEVIANQFPGQEMIPPFLFNAILTYFGYKSLNDDMQWLMNQIDNYHVVQLYVFNPVFLHSVLVYDFVNSPNALVLKVYNPNEHDSTDYIYLVKDQSGNFALYDTGTSNDLVHMYHLTDIGCGEHDSVDWNIIDKLEHDARVLDFIWNFAKSAGQSFLGFMGRSPINILVTDPNGRQVGYDTTRQLIVNDIEGAFYSGNGTEPQILMIPDQINGIYSITVVGTATGNYTFAVEYVNATQTVTQSFNGTISPQEKQTLVASISGTNLASYRCAQMDIDPNVLNLCNKGRWITTYIELGKSFNMQNVNVSSIRLNGTIPVAFSAPVAIGDYDNDGIPDLMVRFDRTAVSGYILSKGVKYGNVTLTVTGQLNDGTEFMGSNVIKVRMPGDVNCDGRVDVTDVMLMAMAMCSYPGHPRWNPMADVNEDGKVNLTDFFIVCLNFGKKYT